VKRVRRSLADPNVVRTYGDTLIELPVLGTVPEPCVVFVLDQKHWGSRSSHPGTHFIDPIDDSVDIDAGPSAGTQDCLDVDDEQRWLHGWELHDTGELQQSRDLAATQGQ
jgi:hypothetical protein